MNAKRNDEGIIVEMVKKLVSENDRLRTVNARLTEMVQVELAGLKGERVRPVKLVESTKSSKPAKPAESTKSSKPMKVHPVKVSPAKPAVPKKVGTKIVRKDGHVFTRTAKVAAARKIQGQYLGGLRVLHPSVKKAVQKIAHEKSVSAAVKVIVALKAGKSLKVALAAGR